MSDGPTIATSDADRAAELYEALFAHSADGVLLSRPDGTVLRANPAAVLILERSEEEICRLGRAGLVVPGPEMDALLAEREREGIARGEVQMLRADGTPFPVEITSAIVRLSNGERCAFIIFRDITARWHAARWLQESERRAVARAAEVQTLLDAVPAAVFLTRDPDASRMEANRFCADMLRMPRGQNVSKSAPEADRPMGFRATRDGVEIPPAELPVQLAAATGREVRDYELDLVFEDGTVRHLVGNAAPLFDASRAPAGAVGAFVDITERTRAEVALRASEARFRILADAMPHIVCAMAPDGTPEYVNAQWCAFSGLTAVQSLQRGWPGVLHPDDVPAAIACLKRVRDTRTVQEVELRYRAADGSFRWFLSRLAPVIDEAGRLVRYIGAGTDIDDRRRAEQGREQLLEAVQEADRRKADFLAVLSHELRNPLAAIRNSAYVLERAAPGSPVAEHARGVVDRQTSQLTRLVDDLLDVTRISRGKIELRRERLDLREIVRRTCDDHRRLCDASGLELRIELAPRPLWLEADAARISQVLGNLLQNAAKFTPAGGIVTVRAEAEGDRAVLRVRDTGVGMDAPHLERVFEPFVQVDSSLARTAGGLGLGLSLVKGLAELHGGAARARSEGEGRGAEFEVLLPLAAAPAPAASPTPEPLAAPEARTVVVIEDNVDAADTLADVLQLSGHRVEIARDGRSGVALVRAVKPDVVLCDIGLPDLDGFEVARTLRSDASLAGVRLVALTGYAQPEDRRRAFDAGFDRHLAKPPTLEALEAVVAEAGPRGRS